MRYRVLCILVVLPLLAGACRSAEVAPSTDTPHPSVVLPVVELGATATVVPTVSDKPTMTPIPTPTPTPIVHIVQKGEILGQIAIDYNVSVDALMLANALDNAHVLSIGQRLVIPNASMLAQMVEGGWDVDWVTPTPAFPTPTLLPASISWLDAPDHVGETVVVEGLVVRTRQVGDDIYLYFEWPSLGLLRILVPEALVKSFATPPQIYCLDRYIWVQGAVIAMDEGVQITLASRAHLKVLDR